MAPSPPASCSPRKSRRDEIIGQAIDVFGEHGFVGGRIDDVALRVGLRRPSILYHFCDKAALYGAAIDQVLGELVRRIEAAEASAQERLDSISDAWVDFVIDRPNAARLLLRQMIDSNPQPLQSAELLTRRLIQAIRDAIEDQAGPLAAKELDATELSLVLASTSLVWVASRSAVEGAFGLDTLSPGSIARHRRMLHTLTQQLISARQADAPISPPGFLASAHSITTDKSDQINS
jgi:TetR/AcrR family transcriptional regulator